MITSVLVGICVLSCVYRPVDLKSDVLNTFTTASYSKGCDEVKVTYSLEKKLNGVYRLTNLTFAGGNFYENSKDGLHLYQETKYWIISNETYSGPGYPPEGLAFNPDTVIHPEDISESWFEKDVNGSVVQNTRLRISCYTRNLEAGDIAGITVISIVSVFISVMSLIQASKHEKCPWNKKKHTPNNVNLESRQEDLEGAASEEFRFQTSDRISRSTEEYPHPQDVNSLRYILRNHMTRGSATEEYDVGNSEQLSHSVSSPASQILEGRDQANQVSEGSDVNDALPPPSYADVVSPATNDVAYSEVNDAYTTFPPPPYANAVTLANENDVSASHPPSYPHVTPYTTNGTTIHNEHANSDTDTDIPSPPPFENTIVEEAPPPGYDDIINRPATDSSDEENLPSYHDLTMDSIALDTSRGDAMDHFVDRYHVIFDRRHDMPPETNS